MEFRPAYHSGQSEYELFRDLFREDGYAVEILSPERIEYRNRVLHKAGFSSAAGVVPTFIIDPKS